MERRAGDLIFGKTLVFSKFQMTGKSYFTDMPISRVSVLCGGSTSEFVKEFILTSHQASFP